MDIKGILSDMKPYLHYRLKVYVWLCIFTLPAVLLFVGLFIAVLFDVDHMRKMPNLA